jgi:hypothetical protein
MARLGAEGSEQRTRIEVALTNTEPSHDFGTPTHDAYNFAVAELERTVVPRDQRYVLLITDGQPTFLENCIGSGLITEPVDETPIINAIAAARSEGIGTFVIGAPGSEVTASAGVDARPWLSRAAEAGGTARDGCQHTGNPYYCHFDMVEELEFGVGLRNALTQIVGAILPCSYLVPIPPPGQQFDPDLVNVVLIPAGAEPLLAVQSRQADCAEGWRFSADGREIELCGATCSTVQADPHTQIELFFGCATADIVH